jgi:uncharacterized membrane protein
LASYLSAAGVHEQAQDNVMKPTMTLGLTVLAGVALFEVALIPGIVIGGAAVLAPKYLPKLRRRLRPVINSAINRRSAPAAPKPEPAGARMTTVPAALGIKQAIAKTITFRIIVTTLDFTTNYVVIGEFATAAGLSTFNLVTGPLFYLAHETAWNYFGPDVESAVDVAALLPGRRNGQAPARLRTGFTISRALAKTITFRTIATVIDFTVNYVVVRDVATAAGLSAFAFVVGPFVYLGHEKAWDYFNSRGAPILELPPPTKLLPPPSSAPLAVAG